MRISRKQLVYDLISHGVIPNKTKCLVFPKLEQEYIRHFIRGYFDGDGSWYIHRNQLTFSLCSSGYDFLCHVRKILDDALGVGLNKLSSGEGAYHLGYMGNIKSKKLFNYMYEGASVWLERKIQKAMMHFDEIAQLN